MTDSVLNILSVSYTHLAVYKRQARILVEKVKEKMYVVQNPPAMPLTQMEMDDVYSLPYMRAVSYTHLDVYKRQILSTIQNLYKVANKQVVIKIQDEFYEIYEKGDINELSRFSRQLDIIAEDYRAQSVQ